MLDDGMADIQGEKKTVELVDWIDFDDRNIWGFPKLIKKFSTYEEEVEKILYLGMKHDSYEKSKKQKKIFIYGSYSINRTNLKGSTVAFYTEDNRFENFYDAPSGPMKTLINVGVQTCLGFDFSTYFAMPKVERLWNIYKSLHCTRYVQESGVNVIPTIIGTPDDFQYFRDCIPKGAPLAVQIHRHYTKKEFDIKKKLIKAWLEYVNPPFVWVYYSKTNKPYFEKVLGSVKTIWVASYSEQKFNS